MVNEEFLHKAAELNRAADQQKQRVDEMKRALDKSKNDLKHKKTLLQQDIKLAQLDALSMSQAGNDQGMQQRRLVMLGKQKELMDVERGLNDQIKRLESEIPNADREYWNLLEQARAMESKGNYGDQA